MKLVTVGAIIGLTLVALVLNGSTRSAAPLSPTISSAETDLLHARFRQAQLLLSQGRYFEARDVFRAAAERAETDSLARLAANYWNGAGFCSIAAMQYAAAHRDLTKARAVAETNRQPAALAHILNNLASLYMHMGQPAEAERLAREALAGPVEAEPAAKPRIQVQLAGALFDLGRINDAVRFYREAIDGLLDGDQTDLAVIALGSLGADSLDAGRTADAQWALEQGLSVARIHKLAEPAGILASLARLRARQGDNESAAKLFDAALAAPPNITPRWRIFADRARFRAQLGDLPNALADFREARRIAARLRADIVPADEDRVAVEKGLSPVMQGLVDTGNRLAGVRRGDALLRETFDAAEQDRLWSLRALLPAQGDWRSRLPERYWDLLARYQAGERASVGRGTDAETADAASLLDQMGKLEAQAAGDVPSGLPLGEGGESPLVHARHLLGTDSVLFSFYISNASSWVWAVDRDRVDVFRLPPAQKLRTDVAEFAAGLRQGVSTVDSGAALYNELFGQIPESYLRRGRWLLELDGPLYELPLAALVTKKASGSAPALYLIERATLETIPGALLLERGQIRPDGDFLGIADPVYNLADPRYKGVRKKPVLSLARAPNTARDVEACARALNPASARVLTGLAADVASVRSAAASAPSIIHFATHVVTEPGAQHGGLIALSLDSAGQMGLLGPREIAARPTRAELVVMNGCHSAQGEALPGAGLMGLTRAWIGAGARAVIATQWDIPDTARSLMPDFYAALRAEPDRGPGSALRHAQLLALNTPGGRENPAAWAGYFLLTRYP